MTVETHVHDALERVGDERESVGDKLTAMDRFATKVDGVAPVSSSESTTRRLTAGGSVAVSTAVQPETASADRRQTVRELFAETIRPHSVDDIDQSEPLQETIATEFSSEIAVALAPTTNRQFTPDLKRSVLSVTQTRRGELETMKRGLETEAESLRSAVATLEEITDWIVRADETPLLQFGFDELSQRHETLTRYRARCRRLLRDRQTVLQGTTTRNGTGIPHQTVVRYLYQNGPTTYPVLSTTLRLEECCRRCQRTVRDHLTHRV